MQLSPELQQKIMFTIQRQQSNCIRNIHSFLYNQYRSCVDYQLFWRKMKALCKYPFLIINATNVLIQKYYSMEYGLIGT